MKHTVVFPPALCNVAAYCNAVCRVLVSAGWWRCHLLLDCALSPFSPSSYTLFQGCETAVNSRRLIADSDFHPWTSESTSGFLCSGFSVRPWRSLRSYRDPRRCAYRGKLLILTLLTSCTRGTFWTVMWLPSRYLRWRGIILIKIMMGQVPCSCKRCYGWIKWRLFPDYYYY
jgi:hypothetical protein